jgi:hypothetical protein
MSLFDENLIACKPAGAEKFAAAGSRSVARVVDFIDPRTLNVVGKLSFKFRCIGFFELA